MGASGNLVEGESLHLSRGIATILSLALVTCSLPVYNIEVHGEHVYQVGEMGVLVHNAYFSDFRFRGAVRIDGLREATHADIVKAFEGGGVSLSNHFITRLKDSRLEKLGMRTFNDLESVLRHGVIEDADDGAIAIVRNGIAIIMDPATKRLITIRPW